jgi:hypothetical protein
LYNVAHSICRVWKGSGKIVTSFRGGKNMFEN